MTAAQTSLALSILILFLGLLSFENHSASDYPPNVSGLPTVHATTISKWVATRVTTGFDGTVRTLYFSGNNGWVYTDNGLFRTLDGGISWTKANLPALNGQNLHSINFVDSNTGVAVFEKDVFANDLEREIHIMVTHDGGDTWSDSFTLNGGEFSDLKNDGERFWISGAKYEHLAPLCFSPLVISSDPSGERWSEDPLLLPTLQQASKVNISCTNQAALALSVLNDQPVKVLISNGVVYERSSDTARSENIFDYTYLRGVVRAFGEKASGEFWSLEGADNEHGTFGELLIKVGNRTIRSFAKSNVVFMGAIYSSNEFILSGMRVEYKFDEKTKGTTETRVGVVFEANDDGDDFQEIFDDPTGGFISIYPIGQNPTKLWIVSEKGSIFQLTRTQL